MAVEQVAHLHQIRLLRLRIGDRIFLAHDRGEAGEQGRGNFGVRGVRLVEHGAFPSGFGRQIDDSRPTSAQAWVSAAPPPAEPVVDGLAEAFVRDRHHGDHIGALAVEGAQVREQVGGRLDEIAALREVEHAHRALGTGYEIRPEREQTFAHGDGAGVEPQRRARGIVRSQHAGRERRVAGHRGLGRQLGERLVERALDRFARQAAGTKHRRFVEAGDDGGLDADRCGAAVDNEFDAPAQIG